MKSDTRLTNEDYMKSIKKIQKYYYETNEPDPEYDTPTTDDLAQLLDIRIHACLVANYLESIIGERKVQSKHWEDDVAYGVAIGRIIGALELKEEFFLGRDREEMLDDLVEKIKDLKSSLTITENELRSARKHAKGEQRAAGKIRSWAVHETRLAYERLGHHKGERKRIQAERDAIKKRLLEIIDTSTHTEAVRIATDTINDIRSGKYDETHP